MDLKTGKVYDSRAAADAAGANPHDLIAVERRYDGTYWPRTSSAPHQSTRECQRRLRQQAAAHGQR